MCHTFGACNSNINCMSILTIYTKVEILDGGRGNLVQGFLWILLEELRKERKKKKKKKKKKPTKPHFAIASKEYFGHKIVLVASVQWTPFQLLWHWN